MASSKIIVFIRVVPPCVDNTSAAQLRSSDNVWPNVTILRQWTSLRLEDFPVRQLHNCIHVPVSNLLRRIPAVSDQPRQGPGNCGWSWPNHFLWIWHPAPRDTDLQTKKLRITARFQTDNCNTSHHHQHHHDHIQYYQQGFCPFPSMGREASRLVKGSSTTTNNNWRRTWKWNVRNIHYQLVCVICLRFRFTKSL